jgi:hypothetical protein
LPDNYTSNIEDIRDPRFFIRQVEDERENGAGH